jgi:ketosteroid isomerase-like protein
VTEADQGDREPRAVIEDHLRLRLAGDLEGDLARNYAEDVVALSLAGGRRGHDGVRAMADDLERAMPDAAFSIDELKVEGEHALLVWSGQSRRGTVREGTDTFVVRGGRIVGHVVHFHVDTDSQAATSGE